MDSYKYIELQTLNRDAIVRMSYVSSLLFSIHIFTCERRQLQRDPSLKDYGSTAMLVSYKHNELLRSHDTITMTTQTSISIHSLTFVIPRNVLISNTTMPQTRCHN